MKYKIGEIVNVHSVNYLLKNIYTRYDEDRHSNNHGFYIGDCMFNERYFKYATIADDKPLNNSIRIYFKGDRNRVWNIDVRAIYKVNSFINNF